MTTHYVGILDGEGDTCGVRIPDVVGCHGGGATPEAAIADATSALREIASHYAVIETPLAAARSAKQIIADPRAGYDAGSGESLVLVPLLLDRGRPVRANISLDAGLLETIDAEAKRRGLTRSAFLASAAIDKITQA
jgi:predicted RNase H-like HicB family nuclease